MAAWLAKVQQVRVRFLPGTSFLFCCYHMSVVESTNSKPRQRSALRCPIRIIIAVRRGRAWDKYLSHADVSTLPFQLACCCLLWLKRAGVQTNGGCGTDAATVELCEEAGHGPSQTSRTPVVRASCVLMADRGGASCLRGVLACLLCLC